MKKLLLSLLMLVVFTAMSIFWWNSNAKSVSNDGTIVRLLIPKGYSATQIANKLASEDLIRSSLAFKFYIQLTGKTKNIQAGEYDLAKNLSLFGVLQEFAKGPTEVWVTVPEGLRREEIVEKFIVGLDKKGDEAISFRSEFLAQSKGFEGRLFPDTYLFWRGTSASKVVNKMTSTFDTKISQSKKVDNATSLTFNERLVLASLIERETITDKERPLVAGILIKRLNAGWPLQVDAANQYAVSTRNCVSVTENCEWWPTLSREDLQIISPFNTYKNQGLPPSPIASPGLTSFEAASNPKNSSYWFYLHDPKGEIHFAETIEEHNINIRKYLGK